MKQRGSETWEEKRKDGLGLSMHRQARVFVFKAVTPWMGKLNKKYQSSITSLGKVFRGIKILRGREIDCFVKLCTNEIYLMHVLSCQGI